MNPFDKAWDVLKIQDWRADNPQKQPFNPLNFIPDKSPNKMQYDPKMGDMKNMPKEPEPQPNTSAWWTRQEQSSPAYSREHEWSRLRDRGNLEMDNPPDQMGDMRSPWEKQSSLGRPMKWKQALLNPAPTHPLPNDPVTEQRNNPMAQVNPNVPKHFQQGNESPNQPPPPPNMDPSWTPEAIARINAQNDESRRALRGGE